jgi:CHAT domain-containing protein
MDSINTIETMRAQTVGTEQDAQRFFEGLISPYNTMICLLAAQGSAAESLAFAERAKARVLLDILRSGRSNVTKAMTAQEKEQERKFKDNLVSLNTQISSENQSEKPDQTRLAQLQAQLERARLDYEDFQTRLYVAHPELRVKRGQVQPFSLEQSAELLPDSNTALLEYAVTDDTTLLFVLTLSPQKGPQKPVLRLYDLKIKHKDLVEQVRKLNQRIANNDIEYVGLSSELYNLLIAPALSQLQGKSTLVIVPDDILWETPFQALRSAHGRFLIQSAAISYAPSLTVLRETIRLKKSPASNTLLAMGNPALAGQTISRSKNVLMSAALEPLPEAERMVRGLAQIYGPQSSKVFIGPEASEETLKAEAGKHRILQLATHGILNNSSPMYSHIVLAQSNGAKEDGLLEAWEIMQMDLKADLAVLSACETARGRFGAGEGVIGLSWALFVAGCPTTVVSQWKVESSSTTELMLEFHRNLKAGASKSDAMRRAALKLMADKRYNHPFYWAAFIVVGDGD